MIEDFIGKVYRERYGKAIEATWLSTIFSMAVSAFLVGGIMGALSGIMYCVRDINAPIYFRQTTNNFNEIWCYDYFNNTEKFILMPPQDLKKVG